MNNYHRHSSYSNISSPDSACFNEEYAKRAVELGDKILASTEHSFQGNYFEVYELAKKYGLKFIYGAEAYWVKDRFEKDRTNSHICIFAKTNSGRKAMNLALAEANETGYHYKPRLDLSLLLSLPPQDVFLTSACLAFWKYEDIEEVVVKLHSHFKENFMLELQYHHTDIQRQVNKKVVELSEKYGIEMIVGMDSHYIYESQHQDREEVLLSKGVKYDDEDGWFMDYPNNDQVIERFKIQGIVPEDKVKKAISNTSIFEMFDDFDNVEIFIKKMKLPSLYKEFTQEEKDAKLKQIIMDNWDIEKKTIEPELHDKYQVEIEKEISIINETKMADYFLIDYELVKDAVSNGGEITPSGRGSGVSNYTNTLLGFSKIDRVSATVTMFPERFMSASRILQSGSIPDLDLNLGNPEVFAESQRKIFGEHNSYPMIAYGTFKKKSAWKMYAKAKNVDFEISNEISSQIEDYEKAYKYADDDERESLEILDFIDPVYHETFSGSEMYQGIIADKKAHPCGWLIYDKDIREEIGIIRAVSESTGKSTIVCLLDGLSAEIFKFLKNDLLKVDVVKLFYAISRNIGKEIPSERELIKLCDGDKEVWDIYANGFTVGVNQVEKDSTTKKVMRYKPKTIAELCAVIAAIRPSFASMYHIFESRKYFEYGIPTFDKIIQSTGLDSSFILYQETIMAVLGFAGFPQDETYDIIKAISKKRKDKIDKIKPRFVENFKKIVIENDGMSEQEADIASEKVWKILEDSSAYGFNASHSYSYAYDSLLCAYYKSKYPLVFYKTLLQEYTEKGNKKKVALLRKEMQHAFSIKINPIKFGQDNRGFSIDEENNSINLDISSMKNIGEDVGKELYRIKDNDYFSFSELLYEMAKNTTVNKAKVLQLIKMDYFSMFGATQKLIDIHTKFFENDIYKKVTAKKENLPFDEELIKKYSEKETPKQFSGVNFVGILSEIESTMPETDISIKDRVKYQLEYLGAIELILGGDKNKTVVVSKKAGDYNTIVELYSLGSGNTTQFKIKKKDYRENFEVGSIIYTKHYEKKFKLTPRKDEHGDIIRDTKGKPKFYDQTEQKEWILESYIVEE